MNLQFVQDAILQHKDEFAAFGLRRIGIFGSLATGVSTVQSDIDLLLEFDPQKKTYRNFYNGSVLLETLLNRPIDAVTPQGLSPYIKPYIDHDITYVQISD